MHDPGPPNSVVQVTRGNSGKDSGGKFTFPWMNWLFNFYQWVKANMARDFYFDVAAGLQQGYSSVNKFGTNASIPDGVEEIVWSPGGAYTFSTTADITHIVSSSASDNGKTVEIQGLDANWSEVTQSKVLGTPATTGVTLDTPLIRAFRLKLNDNPTNVGVVQCGVGAVTTSFTAGNLRAQIEAGIGQTRMAIYTIPANKKAYLTKYYASIIGDPGTPPRIPDYCVFRLYAIDRGNGYAQQLKHVVGASLSGTSLVEHEFIPAGPAGEKTDVYLTAQPEGDIGSVSAGFDIILEDA